MRNWLKGSRIVAAEDAEALGQDEHETRSLANKGTRTTKRGYEAKPGVKVFSTVTLPNGQKLSLMREDVFRAALSAVNKARK